MARPTAPPLPSVTALDTVPNTFPSAERTSAPCVGRVAGELHRHDLLDDVASHLEPADDFLAKVTPLTEAHGNFLESRLLRIVLFAEVDAETGQEPAHPELLRVVGGTEQRVRVLGGEVTQHIGHAARGRGDHAVGRPLQLDGARVHARHRPRRSSDFGGARPLRERPRVFARDVFVRGVLHDEVLFEMFLEQREAIALPGHEQPVAGVQNENVGHDAPDLDQDEPVRSPPRSQLGHVRRHEPIEPALPIGTAHGDGPEIRRLDQERAPGSGLLCAVG